MAEQLNRKDQQTSEATSINLWWRDVKTGPLKTFRQSDAVVDGNIAYFGKVILGKFMLMM